MENIFLQESPFILINSNPYTDELLENWQTIRDEFFNHIRLRGALPNKPNTGTHFDNTLYTGDFSTIGIMLRKSLLDTKEKIALQWQPDEEIRWLEHRIIDQPFLGNWVKKHQDVIGAVVINTANPGSDLNCHWGLDDSYIRLHLCLVEDPGCVFNIEGWKKTWTEGEIFGFDDANVLHGTTHVGNHKRTIVLIDIKKDAIKPYCQNWPCRDKRPAKEYWPKILEKYNS